MLSNCSSEVLAKLAGGCGEVGKAAGVALFTREQHTVPRTQDTVDVEVEEEQRGNLSLYMPDRF